MARILVADDDNHVREGISRTLKRGGHIIDGVSNGSDALRLVRDQRYDVVLTDMRMPGCDGMEVLREVKSISPLTDVIVITAYGTVEEAVEAMRLGAFDYLLKPFSVHEVDMKVGRVLEGQRLRRRSRELEESVRSHVGSLVGCSHAMRSVRDYIARAVEHESPVLIEGQSGTGKELVAREISRMSGRSNAPFVTVGCVGLTVEHFMRDFVGGIVGEAGRYCRGRLQEAEGGTVFFDEIGELPVDAQLIVVKLIDEGVLNIPGACETIPLDVRIIASTHTDLEQLVARGTFRGELLGRLRSYIISVPPLIKRVDDIPELVEHFLAKYNRAFVKRVEINPEVLGLLRNYAWPGNVRELENVISQAVILAQGAEVTPRQLPEYIVGHFHEVETAAGGQGKGIAGRMKSMEREVIVHALKDNGWNQLRTAEALDMNRSTLQYKIKKYGIRMQRRRRTSRM